MKKVTRNVLGTGCMLAIGGGALVGSLAAQKLKIHPVFGVGAGMALATWAISPLADRIEREEKAEEAAKTASKQ